MINIESPQNYEQKCLCVLLLDTSGSMAGDSIQELQRGIELFHKEISKDSITSNRLEVAIITFGYSVDVIQQPALINDFIMPKLQADGSTPMGEAINEGINLIDARKSWYKQTGQPYYRPWLIAITDGEPTDIPDYNDVHNKIQAQVQNKSYIFYAIGVRNANMGILQTLSSNQMPPAKLEGLKFAEFFSWLSASMTQVTSSNDGATVNLPSPSDWMEGFKI